MKKIIHAAMLCSAVTSGALYSMKADENNNQETVWESSDWERQKFEIFRKSPLFLAMVQEEVKKQLKSSLNAERKPISRLEKRRTEDREYLDTLAETIEGLNNELADAKDGADELVKELREKIAKLEAHAQRVDGRIEGLQREKASSDSVATRLTNQKQELLQGLAAQKEMSTSLQKLINQKTDSCVKHTEFESVFFSAMIKYSNGELAQKISAESLNKFIRAYS